LVERTQNHPILQLGIESFLSTTDSLQPGHENVCEPFDSYWQKVKKERITTMAWKLRKWKRAVEQLPNRYRSMVVGLFSAFGDEETTIARAESDGHSDCVTTSSVRQTTE
jgi:hypothetical protein